MEEEVARPCGGSVEAEEFGRGGGGDGSAEAEASGRGEGGAANRGDRDLSLCLEADACEGR